jgi:hypothetical protein
VERRARTWRKGIAMDDGHIHAVNVHLFGFCLNLIKFLLVFVSESYPLSGLWRLLPRVGWQSVSYSVDDASKVGVTRFLLAGGRSERREM